MLLSTFSASRTAIALALLVPFSLAAPAALAQSKRQLSPEQQSALQENCAGDYLRLCGQYSPDGPEVDQCFKAKAKELSPDCASAITAYNKSQPRRR